MKETLKAWTVALIPLGFLLGIHAMLCLSLYAHLGQPWRLIVIIAEWMIFQGIGTNLVRYHLFYQVTDFEQQKPREELNR